MALSILPNFDHPDDRPLPPEKPSRPIPKPSNDDPPFRHRRPPKSSPFGRRPPPIRFNPMVTAPRLLPRLIPGLGLALPLIDLVDGLMPTPDPNPMKLPRDWCLTAECNTGPPSRWSGHIRVNTSIERGGNNCDVNVDCLSGQAITSGSNVLFGEPFEVTTTGRHVGMWYRYTLPSGTVRFKHYRSYYRPGAINAPSPVRWSWSRPLPVDMDPNWYRQQPGSDPYPAGPVPIETPTPEQPPVFQWDNTPKGRPRPRRHQRRRPPRGTKENKNLTRSARLGIWLYRALDNISEWAEVVDAVYEALPERVKDRWEADRYYQGHADSRGFIDQAGQYGLDGADWKLEALWHNWHKVDAEEAVQNIIKNYVEDQVIGGYQRHMPRNVVNALDQIRSEHETVSPEMAVSKLVNAIFEEIGW